MTTSVSNAETSVTVVQPATAVAKTSSPELRMYRIRHTLASRFAFLVICVAIVMSALAYGTVHYWALGLFNLGGLRSEEHTSELQSRFDLVCRLLLEKKKKKK